jgi:hypothetical protein
LGARKPAEIFVAWSGQLERTSHAEVVLENDGDLRLVFLVADLNVPAMQGVCKLISLVFAAEMADVLAFVILGTGVVAVLDEDNVTVFVLDARVQDFAIGAGPRGCAALAEFLPESTSSGCAAEEEGPDVVEEAEERREQTPPVAMHAKLPVRHSTTEDAGI